MNGIDEAIMRGHQFTNYPLDPTPYDLFVCNKCGHVHLALEIQHAKYNYPCPYCSNVSGLLGTHRVRPIDEPAPKD